MTLKLIAAALLVALLISMWIINYLLMLIREGSLLDRPTNERGMLQHEGIGSIQPAMHACHQSERINHSSMGGGGVYAAWPKCPVCGQANELESVELDAVEMPGRVSGSREIRLMGRPQSPHDLINTSK